jgi:hypothetical protein
MIDSFLSAVHASELCRYVDHNSLRNNTTILLVGSKVIKRIIITTTLCHFCNPSCNTDSYVEPT